MRRAAPSHGFTLVEVLVALAILSAIALLSWRAIDGMGRTQAATQTRADAMLRLQAAFGQWNADLDALIDTREVTPIEFNGQLLRLTRRDPMETGLDSRGIRVVAWALLPGPGGLQWSRWQSGPLRQRDELARAWQRAAEWAAGRLSPGTGGADALTAPQADSALALVRADAWQLYYHRGETWTNPQSAADVGSRGSEEDFTPNAGLPNGVRLQLTLGPGLPLQGMLVRDWVRPTLEAAP
ncbi:MAG: prepilin-type N-terminal cleavage/methylation domain-containing protein [Hydrogenophaga sp.]|uniref:prepilin-type N-terminal cleavage/methylation domain-containing protein n=1 Tax=Hydrogenophaga sp. TaxID=1904254 RepID=UPI001DE87607|nr:prepilin-type N-terminal cleavage/methylation domain-containing protein [Hydrogenophaga sp.]MBX3609735.1 prepilin-type N-terminal cleavage/methylation domain-containing protein [Hydrogenophaga sp.]